MSSSEDIPAPPVRYAHAPPEGEELKQWKTSVLAMINKRIDLYPLPPSNALPARIFRGVLSLLARMRRFLRSLFHPLRSKATSLCWSKAPEQDQQVISLDPDRVVTATERVGHIPELVENILHFAEPATQISSAWDTSFAWRQAVVHVLSTSGGIGSFRGTHPCGAVERDQKITPEFALVGSNPTPEEIKILHRDGTLASEYLRPIWDARTSPRPQIHVPRFPTRLTCSTLLPRALADMYNELRTMSELNWGCCGAGLLNWHDFSQLRINPYLRAVFHDINSNDMETIEIRLRSQSNADNALYPGARPSALLDVIQSMQLSEPPCKAVDVCVEFPHWYCNDWKVYPSGAPVNISHAATYRATFQINKIINKNGVTCGQIIEVLERRMRDCSSQWRLCAVKLRKEIEDMEDCLDLWCLSGAPTFVVRLGKDDTHFDDRRKESDRHNVMLSSPAIERQLEWLPMELVRVDEYTQIRDGKIYHYPADLED